MNAIKHTRRGMGMGLTLVISTVLFSISRSSAVRSVNPGRTCFACSFSSVDTASRARQCQLRNGNGVSRLRYALFCFTRVIISSTSSMVSTLGAGLEVRHLNIMQNSNVGCTTHHFGGRPIPGGLSLYASIPIPLSSLPISPARSSPSTPSRLLAPCSSPYPVRRLLNFRDRLEDPVESRTDR